MILEAEVEVRVRDHLAAQRAAIIPPPNLQARIAHRLEIERIGRAPSSPRRLQLAVLIGFVTLIAGVGAIVGQSRMIVAPPRSAQQTGPASILDDPATLDQLAQRDLAALPARLHFSPLLPGPLPSGFRYVRVVHPGAAPGSLRAFDICISGPDDSLGSRAIHLHEGESIGGADGKASPLDVYRNVLRPIALSNGTWYAMQNRDNPYPRDTPYGGGIGGPDDWIFMMQHGAVFIQVDGLASKETLQTFAGSLR